MKGQVYLKSLEIQDLGKQQANVEIYAEVLKIIVFSLTYKIQLLKNAMFGYLGPRVLASALNVTFTS